MVDQTVYLSGCIGLDPSTANLVSGGIEPEAEQVCTSVFIAVFLTYKLFVRASQSSAIELNWAVFYVPANTVQVIWETVFTGQKTQPTVSKYWRRCYCLMSVISCELDSRLFHAADSKIKIPLSELCTWVLGYIRSLQSDSVTPTFRDTWYVTYQHTLLITVSVIHLLHLRSAAHSLEHFWNWWLVQRAYAAGGCTGRNSLPEYLCHPVMRSEQFPHDLKKNICLHGFQSVQQCICGI